MAMARPGARGVRISGQAGASGLGGALYVRGRLAAGLGTWTLHEDTCAFTVLPQTVDPLWAHGAISHISFFYRGRHWVYRVLAGFLADGRLTIQWPSWLRMDTAPGPRLPML